MVVTRGSSGAILYKKSKNKFFYCPAFARKIVDKIGAGDAMLSLSSLMLSSGFDENLALFFGSLAAAQSVETINNSSPIQKKELLKIFNHITK